MATAAPERRTLAEFLAWDDGTGTHHELVRRRRQIVAMAPPDRQHVAEPVLIAEVLSPSTAQYDRGTKLPDYCEIPSVREILLVSSTERRVELWRRDGPRWTVERLIGEAELRLEVIDAAIPLAAVYAGTAV